VTSSAAAIHPRPVGDIEVTVLSDPGAAAKSRVRVSE